VVVLVVNRVVYSKKYHLHSVLDDFGVRFGGPGWTLGSGLGLAGGSDLGSDLGVRFEGSSLGPLGPLGLWYLDINIIDLYRC